jgi:hypothetical protein
VSGTSGRSGRHTPEVTLHAVQADSHDAPGPRGMGPRRPEPVPATLLRKLRDAGPSSPLGRRRWLLNSRPLRVPL